MKETRAHRLWSRFRAWSEAFTLRKRIIAILISVAIFLINIFALWAFFNQQGVWIGSLFFHKASENRYEASALRNPQINSYAAIELEQNDGYRVLWDGYEWYGIMALDNFYDESGNIISVDQMPFWQRLPNISDEGEDFHKYYFMWKLRSMRASSLEPLVTSMLSLLLSGSLLGSPWF